MDGTLFLVVLAAAPAGVVLYQARHEDPRRLALALVGGLVLAAGVVVAMSWAGIDLGRLYLLLAPAVAIAFVATFAIVLRLAQRRRAAPAAKSPYDFT